MDTDIQDDRPISIEVWEKDASVADVQTVGLANTTYLSQNCTANGTAVGNYSGYCGPPTLPPLPPELTFNEDTLVSIAAYSCLLFVAALGNLIVFITLFRNRHRKSRVNMFIMHLAMADMEVTFIMMPIEISWHSTVQWLAGEVSCRVLMFFRAFGFYLSSYILVAISLDRYFAITHPLSMQDADKRAKIMLGISWGMSVASSLPQVRHEIKPPIKSHKWDLAVNVCRDIFEKNEYRVYIQARQVT